MMANQANVSGELNRLFLRLLFMFVFDDFPIKKVVDLMDEAAVLSLHFLYLVCLRLTR
jgi:hypothetical protein